MLGSVVLAGCGGEDSGGEAASDTAEVADAAGVELAQEPVGGHGEAADEAAAGAPPTLAAEGQGVERVIREGTVVVEVADAGFDRAYDRVVAEARDLGGAVQTSNTTTSDDGLLSGSLTVRVPTDRYESLLTRVGEVGTVLRRSLASEDVTSEFIDLQARRRNLEAQQRFYLDLLTLADGVQGAIAVQQQLNEVTEALEQVKGRLQFLENRTELSRLTVELFEAGAVPPDLEPASAPGLASFVERAERAFVTVVGGLLVLLAGVLPLAAVGLVALALWRWRRTAPATVSGEERRSDRDATGPPDREPERV